MTGPEDWDIRGELDAADGLVDTVSAPGDFAATELNPSPPRTESERD